MARQMSFFSAESAAPVVGDLAGLLCGSGRAVTFAKRTARLSVAVGAAWRAKALVAACAERGVPALVDDGEVVTPFRADLAPLAAEWGCSGGKVVPVGFAPGGAVLRVWVLASGRWGDGGYVLPLDPDAPGTHEALGEALERAGLPVSVHVDKGGEPGLRVSGRRRLARLVELVGPPAGPGCVGQWPAVSRMRAVS